MPGGTWVRLTLSSVFTRPTTSPAIAGQPWRRFRSRWLGRSWHRLAARSMHSEGRAQMASKPPPISMTRAPTRGALDRQCPLRLRSAEQWNTAEYLRDDGSRDLS